MIAPLLIRADGSALIGAGHVMRCLALAQSWQQAGGPVVFAQAETTPALTHRLQAENAEVVGFAAVTRGSAADADQTIALARARGAQWIAADGYCFDSSWQKQIRDAGLRLLVIDDYGHTDHYHADIILNQNLGTTSSLYPKRNPDTRLLLGSRYALLRGEFLTHRRPSRTTPERAQKILVTMGGGDPDNVTAKALAALQQIPNIEATVVVGGSNPHIDEIKSAVSAGPSSIRLVVNATNMPELMEWADIAVSAAGSTSWELAYTGLPSVLIVVADNQTGIAHELDRKGISINLGAHTAVTATHIADAVRKLAADKPHRAQMSELGQRLIDGHGAQRVTAALGRPLAITFVSDEGTWLNESIPALKAELEIAGHRVSWLHDPKQLGTGDIAFFLSLSRIVPVEALRRNAHNLVVHESALPQGRGWSPLTWQILEGKNEIPISLIEAVVTVDAGEIYAQDVMRFHGGELVHELREAQASATLRLCRGFVARYPFICSEGRPQTGEPSFYPRRRPEDSRLDLDKSLREQFNLLRVVDPDRYPAFFEIAGRRYTLKIQAAQAPAVSCTDNISFTLLLTGAGGVAVPGLVQHLRSKGVRTLTADMNPAAPGLVLGDKGFCIPPATSPDFAGAIRRICENEKVDVIVPLVDEELLPLQSLNSRTLHVLTPREPFIATCLDKFVLCTELARQGIPVPKAFTADTPPATLQFPIILKPRTGRGSRGVCRIDSNQDLVKTLAALDRPLEEMMLQEFIDGPEFTISVVVSRDGAVQAVVPKEIIVKKGVTQMAVTRNHSGIERLCHRLQETLRADGPFNVQLRLHPVSGEPLLFEINPRFSTTVTHTMAAGIDELYGLALQAVHGRDAHIFGSWKSDLVLRRRSVDEFISEADFREQQRIKLCDVRS